MTLNKASLLAALALSSFSWLCFAQAPVDSASATVTAPALLRESAALSAGFVPQSRCALLFRLAEAAEQVDPALSKRWSDELFMSSFDIPPSWDRSALQKNALVVLSHHDPALAFERQAMMDPPFARDGWIAEDVRAYLAAALFPIYGAPKPAVARVRAIRDRASEIGSNGAYPYRGVGPILKYLWETDAVAAKAWWQEIMGYFGRQSRVANANQEFLVFLDGMWDTLSEIEKRGTLETIRGVLAKGSPYSFATNATYRATVETNHGTFEIKERNHFLLLKILPRIGEYLPDTLSKMRDMGPVFAAAAVHPDFLVRSAREAVIYSKSGNSPPASAAAAKMMDEQKAFEQVRDLAPKDPAKAVLLAGQMGVLQNQAFALIAGVAEQSEPSWGNKLVLNCIS